MEGFKKFIRNIGEAPVTSLFTTSTVVGLADMARTMFELSGNAAIVAGVDGVVVYVNPVAEKLTGTRPQNAVGKPLANSILLSNPKTGEALDIPLRKVQVEARAMFLPGYTTLTQPGGQKIPVDGSLSPVFARDGRVLGAILLLHDVSRYRLMTDALSLQANQDPLTGLVNRREFETRIGQAISKARMRKGTHALAYLDLDRFKIVNDVCGHAAGDELLRTIANVLRGKLRDRDTLARLGGDEFGLLLENCTLEAAKLICGNLQDAVKEIRFAWDGKNFTVGVSIGISVVDETTADTNTALAVSDAACYRAKENGRNRIEVHNPKFVKAQSASESSAIIRIVSALEENRFTLFAQPIVAVAGPEQGDSYEILAKMVGARGELISPADFLPAAERYHLMPTLDRWIIGRAFAAHSNLYRGKPVDSVAMWSINVAASSLVAEGFAAYVAAEAKRHGVPPGRICFEISEAATLMKNSRVTDFIWALKSDGFRFCIDDFGKSLGLLGEVRALPVDFLKIDGAFVREMLADCVGLGMVEAIHRIGKILGMKTIAECVESAEAFARIKLIGIDYAQGYACGGPAPLENLSFHAVPRLPVFAVSLQAVP